MTIEIWQKCLLRFEAYGTNNERMMAYLLLELSNIDNPAITRIFDKYASEILEAAP
jgi:hypothetical protein